MFVFQGYRRSGRRRRIWTFKTRRTILSPLSCSSRGRGTGLIQRSMQERFPLRLDRLTHKQLVNEALKCQINKAFQIGLSRRPLIFAVDKDNVLNPAP